MKQNLKGGNAREQRCGDGSPGDKCADAGASSPLSLILSLLSLEADDDDDRAS
jgi:hypothetical protein